MKIQFLLIMCLSTFALSAMDKDVAEIKPLPNQKLSIDVQLRLAATKGDAEAVKKALSAGANINGQDALGQTALHRAIQENHRDAFIILMERKPNLTLADSDGMIPFHYAVQKGNMSILPLIALYHSIDMNVKNKEGDTPLMIAVKAGHFNAVEYLCCQCANVFIRNRVGQNAYELCDGDKYPQIKEYLAWRMGLPSSYREPSLLERLRMHPSRKKVTYTEKVAIDGSAEKAASDLSDDVDQSYEEPLDQDERNDNGLNKESPQNGPLHKQAEAILAVLRRERVSTRPVNSAARPIFDIHESESEKEIGPIANDVMDQRMVEKALVTAQELMDIEEASQPVKEEEQQLSDIIDEAKPVTQVFQLSARSMQEEPVTEHTEMQTITDVNTSARNPLLSERVVRKHRVKDRGKPVLQMVKGNQQTSHQQVHKRRHNSDRQVKRTKQFYKLELTNVPIAPREAQSQVPPTALKKRATLTIQRITQ